MSASHQIICEFWLDQDDAQPGQLRLSGEIDLSNTELLAHALGEHWVPGRDLCVDVSAVTFIDVVGIETFLAVAQRVQAAGGRLRLIRPSRAVARVMKLARLEPALS